MVALKIPQVCWTLAICQVSTAVVHKNTHSQSRQRCKIHCCYTLTIRSLWYACPTHRNRRRHSGLDVWPYLASDDKLITLVRQHDCAQRLHWQRRVLRIDLLLYGRIDWLHICADGVLASKTCIRTRNWHRIPSSWWLPGSEVCIGRLAHLQLKVSVHFTT